MNRTTACQRIIQPHTDFIHESFIGSKFIGRVEEVTRVGDFEAVIPSIKGWARVYGHNTMTIDTEDPYAFGFQVL